MNILRHVPSDTLRAMLEEIEEERHQATRLEELALLLGQQRAIENELASRVQ